MVRNSQDLKNETTLWELFRNGEESAFSALFELTSDKLYRYGTKFVSDEESVKDCIQELFIKLYENRQQLPALSNPLFYLFSSLKNLLIDMIRHNQRMVYISPEELPFHVQFAFGQEEDEEPDESIKARFEEVLIVRKKRFICVFRRKCRMMKYPSCWELIISQPVTLFTVQWKKLEVV